jgi:hypothetical protein
MQVWEAVARIDASAEAVRFVNDAVGTSSIRVGQPFERHSRDAHVLLQHSSNSSAQYGSAGRFMFGLQNDWVWLSFQAVLTAEKISSLPNGRRACILQRRLSRNAERSQLCRHHFQAWTRI